MTNRFTYITEDDYGQFFRIEMVRSDTGEWQQVSRVPVTIIERELFWPEKLFVWSALTAGLLIWWFIGLS